VDTAAHAASSGYGGQIAAPGYLGDVMNLEQIPAATLWRWGLFTLATVVAWVLLGLNDLAGLIPVSLGFIHLYLFRPVVTPHVTDAEIAEWLSRG
jgi:hypothetical protein